MKDIIKKYLEEQAKKDNAIKESYDPKKIDDCIEYIKSQARKQAVNGFCAIEDNVVYKWARDFMLGDTSEENITTSELNSSVVKENLITEEEPEEEIEEDKSITKKASKTTKMKFIEDDDGQLAFDFGD